MGRLHHLKQTLLQNITDNEDYSDLEFLVLDYNSPDGLETWIKTEYKSLIDSGQLAYYRESTATEFKRSHAKNMAHCLATGQIVMNLDADNWTGKKWAIQLNEKFEIEQHLIIRVGGSDKDDVAKSRHEGAYGRIALQHDDFHRIRGYDELMYGWGFEDNDLLNRGQREAGLTKVILIQDGPKAIIHDDIERIERHPHGGSINKQRNANMRRSRSRAPGKINKDGYGRGIVFKNFDPTPIHVGMD
jgi:glycosyltransferase involved in cell wall biosynthesis